MVYGPSLQGAIRGEAAAEKAFGAEINRETHHE